MAPKYKGLDLLGLARMDVRMLLRNIEPETAIGVLAGTFGDYRPNLTKLLDSGKVPAVRVHLSNGSCARNRVCEVGEPRAIDYRLIGQRAKRVEALANLYPEVEFFVSPRLEYDETDGSIHRNWVEVLMHNAPTCRMIFSPFAGSVPKNAATERHGNHAKGTIISNDGEALSDAPADWAEGGSFLSLAWLHTMNGRGSSQHDVFVVPSKRKASWFCDQGDIEYCNAWLKGIEKRPKVPGARLLRAPEAWKPVADYSQNRTDTGQKCGCLLIKERLPEFAIETLKGRRIGTLRHVEGLNKGRHRYYASARGVELAKRAGSQWVVFRSGKVRLLVNCLFRMGEQR